MAVNRSGRRLQDRDDKGLAKAIAAKTVSGLAKSLGLTVQAVGQWERIPPERCLAVEAATGVSRHDLRPDVYGPPPEALGSPDQAALARISEKLDRILDDLREVKTRVGMLETQYASVSTRIDRMENRLAMSATS